GASFQTAPGLRGALSVGNVSGGQQTSPLWTSQVGNAEFAEALRLSLAAHQLLDSSGQRLRVEATLMTLSQPLMGLDMQVGATVYYRVVEAASGHMIFERPIAANYTATFGSAVIGVQRLQFANEGAIRANIASFISALTEAEQQRDTRGPLRS
ncbi:MAG TPA: hypothetical protein VEY31_04495, partial [Roseococcus sp.]|nr:hypothetical protein [Roseococcus sp.]